MPRLSWLLWPCVPEVRDAQCDFGSICALSWSLQGVLGTWHWHLDCRDSTCLCCPVRAAVCLVRMMLQSKFHLFLSIFTTDLTTGKGTWSKCPHLPIPCDGSCLACPCHVPASCLGHVSLRAAFPVWGRGCGRDSTPHLCSGTLQGQLVFPGCFPVVYWQLFLPGCGRLWPAPCPRAPG